MATFNTEPERLGGKPATTPYAREFDAFVCHRRSDGQRPATWLRAKLLSYTLPRTLLERLPSEQRAEAKRRRRVFIDTLYESAAPNYWIKIQSTLENSRWLLIIWTPDAGVRRKDAWDAMWEEIAYFRNRGPQEHIVLVLAKGVETQPSPDEILQRYPRMEIRRILQLSPLRNLWLPSYFALQDEFVKIAGVVFDIPMELMPELHQEERRRSLRRVSWTLIFGLFVVAVLVGLLYGRNQALSQANRNLADALVQRGLVAAYNKQAYKALVYLAEARRLDSSARWNAVSILAGTNSVTRVGQLVLKGPIRKINIVPHSSLLAVAYESGIKIIAPDGKVLADLGGSSKFWDFVLDAKGISLVGRRDNDVAVWDLRKPNQPKYAFHAGTRQVMERDAWGLALNRQTEEVAVGLPNGRVQFWNLRSEKWAAVVGDTGDAVAALAISPDGRQLAIARQNSSQIELWDLRKNRVRALLETEATIINCLAFSAESELMSVTGSDGLVRIWDVKNPNSPVPILNSRTAHAGFVWTNAFDSVHSLLATGGDDTYVRLWDGNSGKELANLESHSAAVQSVIFSPDGKFLAAGYADGALVFWSLDEQNDSEILLRHNQNLSTTAAFGEGADRLALAASPGDVWADISGLNPYILRRNTANELLGQPWSSGGIEYDPTVARLVDPHSGTTIANLEDGKTAAAVTFNSKGTLVAGGGYGEVLIWDAVSGKLRTRLPTGYKGVTCLGFSEDDTRLAAAFEDRLELSAPGRGVNGRTATSVIVVWDLTTTPATTRWVISTDEFLPKLFSQSWMLKSLSFDPGNAMISGQDENGHISIWDLRTGSLKSPATANSGESIRAINREFSQVLICDARGRLHIESFPRRRTKGRAFAQDVVGDATLLVSGEWRFLALRGGNGALEIWDLRSLTLLGTPIQDASPLAFDPSGEILVATLNRQHSIGFWDTRSGVLIGARRMETLPSEALFHPSGSILALSIHNGQIALLQGMPQVSAEQAEKVSGFRLVGVGLENLSTEREARIYGGMPEVDTGLEDFWLALWQVKFNLRDSPANLAVQPLREWIQRYPAHPMVGQAAKRLEELLPLPDTRQFVLPKSGGTALAGSAGSNSNQEAHGILSRLEQML